ncbi:MULTISPECIES: transglutaminase family protein [unclassified Oceanobacter]|jgi:transglutaminase-like putative cysteine protease|uniref:transglutaminase-like domain-containing protein n=1 Tax=unclassified Oceanobacter TaxID=2620260 RepID=UPI0026E2A8F0|nr:MULTISPECIES: transglutaminase family protein [unclassified Oceanobacter]MDO6682276.1 transglutaminase family protein [Oceanobacter sp. 5_MG-2023]MDP2546448.1 transglutaminase family protein [Oceanobacter sp. 4_MG-2023]MDP2609951.1 transglutaminase family protein [Oceanobacter sp. 1_MG-2023]MDP2613221.1 transglutaminase family protein [Oceanobacter sp. 2_MG-2023]
MWISTSCEFSFEISVPTPFILMLRPRRGSQQWVAREEYEVLPSVPVTEFKDSYGNDCQRLIAPPGPFSLYCSAEVMTLEHVEEAPGSFFVEIQHLPADVLNYLLPSRYCESDRFHQLATEITQGCLPGYDQVAAIEDWVRRTIRYEPGTSPLPVSAIEINLRQSGVCRDLSHLCIALCRALSIPARQVVGYLYELQPMDLHAWFEAYVGGRWYTFDATQYGRKGAYVATGYGRDATDVAIYNQYGPPVFPIEQIISVEEIKR